MTGFGKLVDDARHAKLGRRGFLAAALALGMGADEALRERDRKLVQVPAPRSPSAHGRTPGRYIVDDIEVIMGNGARVAVDDKKTIDAITEALNRAQDGFHAPMLDAMLRMQIALAIMPPALIQQRLGVPARHFVSPPRTVSVRYSDVGPIDSFSTVIKVGA